MHCNNQYNYADSPKYSNPVCASLRLKNGNRSGTDNREVRTIEVHLTLVIYQLFISSVINLY